MAVASCKNPPQKKKRKNGKKLTRFGAQSHACAETKPLGGSYTQKRYSGAYERGASGGIEFDDCNLINNPDEQLLRFQPNLENLHGLCLE